MADLGSIGRGVVTSDCVRFPLYAVGTVDRQLSLLGVIEGNVTENGTPIADALIHLFWRSSMQCIGRTWTDANGDYQFTGLDTSKTYVVIAQDKAGGTQYNDQIRALVAPA